MSKDIREIILAKLAKLDIYLGYLKDLQKKEKKDFVNNYAVYGLVERYLHLSIEVLLDIAKLTIIERKLGRPENNHEIFEMLNKEGVLPDSLYQDLKGVAGFRNILVHDYMKIDQEIVYEYLHTKLENFEDFKKVIVKLIED